MSTLHRVAAVLVILSEEVATSLYGIQAPAMRPRLLWESDAVLTRPLLGAADRCGRFVLVDRGEAAPQRFDQQGRRVGAIGRLGDGPMEFRSVAGVGFRGDTLWISDLVHRRVTLIPPAPARASTRSFAHVSVTPENKRDPRFSDSYPTATLGGRWLVPVRARFDLASSAYANGSVLEHHLLLMAHPEQQPDTLAVLPLPHSVMWFAGKDVGTLMMQPLSDDALVSFATNGRSGVMVKRPDGGTVQLLTWQAGALSAPKMQMLRVTSELLTRRAVDSIAASTIKIAGSSPPGFSIADSVRRKLYVPKHLPSVRAVTAGQDGSVWLRTSTITGADVLWLVVAPSTGKVSRVLLPARFRLLETDGTVLWGALSGEDDVETLAAFSLGEMPKGWRARACTVP